MKKLLKLKLLCCLFVSLLTFSLSINASETNHSCCNHNNDCKTIENTCKTIKQHTLDGVKLINVSSNGDVLNLNEVYEMTNNGRLDKINTRYSCNTSSIRQPDCSDRLANNNINSDNVVEECKKFLGTNFSKLGIAPNNLRCYNVMASDKMFVVVFVQTFKGYDIRNSYVRMYVFPNGKIQTFASMYYKDIYDTKEPKCLANNLQLQSSAVLGLNENKQYKVSLGDYVILPEFNGNGYTYKLVNEINIEIPGIELYKAYVDASNNELLQRKNLVFHLLNLPISSKHYGDDPNQPLVTQPLKNLTIKIEGISDAKVSNSSGVLRDLPDDVVGKKFTTNLSGNYTAIMKTIYGSQTSQPYSFEGIITAEGIQMHDSNNYDEIMRSVYNNVGTVRNYYAQMDPSSAGVGKQFPCYVQIIEDTNLLENKGLEFNAYASGDASLTFLCANHKVVFMAKLNKVCFHEYGHSMVHSKYVAAGQMMGMRSLFANEGNADITAAFLTDNPRVFDGVVKTGEEQWALSHNLFRTCDNTYVFPDAIHGEAHADSQLLTGVFWDFKNLVEDFSEVKATVHFAKEYVPDGYTVESVFSNWFDALVRANDRYKYEDDGGVMEVEFEHNFDAIYNAFNKHNVGFDMLINNRFRHNNTQDQKEGNAAPISCDITDFAAPKIIDEVYVNYYTNFNSEIKSVLLTRNNADNGNTYTGEIPAHSEGSRVFYYFTYKDPFSNSINRINRDYFYFVGYSDMYKTECEVADGWGISNANGTTNGWKLAAPTIIYNIDQIPWSQILYSPGYTTSGTKCWMTTIKAVEKGKTEGLKDSTIITSPKFTTTEYANVFLTYQKYLVCGVAGQVNGLTVEVSFDGGDTWKVTQEFKGSRQKPNNWEWQREYVNLTSYKSASEDFSNMFVRFVCYANSNSLGLNVLIDDIALLGSNNPNGIEEQPFINTISISPNPVSNEATLTFPNAVVNPEISITNTLGNEVLNTKLQGEYNFSKINTANLSNGVYFAKVVAGGKIYQTKLVIAR